MMEGNKMLILVLVLLFGMSCSFGAMEEVGSPYAYITPEALKIAIDRVLSMTDESLENITLNCQFSTAKGRRQYQEDRISCNTDMNIPLQGYHERKVVKVGMVGVFDGHIGAEASEMASDLFLPQFTSNALRVNRLVKPDYGYFAKQPGSTPGSVEGVMMKELDHMEFLKEALVDTFKNIDDRFTNKAVKHNLASGTTAVVALLVDDQILVAHVGDSKALLCSENAKSSQNGGSPQLYAEELTRDHTALIDEEGARIEAAGGFIIDLKVPLVMGHLPMTRAIGDLPLKRYGVIAEPEVTEWRPLSEKDRYLVVASDGIFESLSPNEVCNLLEGDEGNETMAAGLIVLKAYSKGSSDNLSVVVVPLFSPQNSAQSVS